MVKLRKANASTNIPQTEPMRTIFYAKPPTTSYIVWNVITAPKESLITPINEHWTSSETNFDQMLWLKGKINQ